MLPGMVPMVGGGDRRLITAINSLGLAANLKLCLDVGDADCYSGTGQTLTDLSGAGSTFLRGATSSGASDDPTFNGVAGGLTANEYFETNGNQFLSIQTQAAWVDALHKASAKWSFFSWFYDVEHTSSVPIFGDANSAGTTNGTGINATSNPNQTQYALRVRNNSAQVMATASIEGRNVGSINCISGSIDSAKGAAGGIGVVNGVTTAFDATYASPSTGTATARLALMSMGSGGANNTLNGGRVFEFAMWQGGALTEGQLLSLYNLTRGRFGV